MLSLWQADSQVSIFFLGLKSQYVHPSFLDVHTHLFSKMSSSSRSSTPSLSSDDSDLPSTSYDGSHLPWRKFRKEVLAAHQIRILDSAPKDCIPPSFLQIVEAANKDTSRFDGQKKSFWTQVTTGRGFGPSPIFPPNLLPPLSSDLLSRSMVPSFGSREALPERVQNQLESSYELSMPHPGLGCGYSATAFTSRELSLLPQWLQTTGTIVHWDTGYLNPCTTTYCPFLTFERAFGNKEHRVEAANNQCAIDGSFCVRAFQMLYARAAEGSNGYQKSELPVAFSCTIDNSFAVLNLHWIDVSQGQSYCMAPLCQFDLSKDAHFSKFLVWTQAIGDWALLHVLPKLKDALDRLSRSTSPVTPAPFYPIRRAGTMPRATLRLDTGPTVNKDEILLSSLKTAFGETPWRFEEEPDSAVSSSTASWGSPMVADFTFSNLSYPTVHPPRSNASAPNSSIVARRRIGRVDSRSPMVAPPTSYQQNQETMWQKRFNGAMGEIKELQNQLQAFEREVKALKGSLRAEPAPKAAAPANQVGQVKEEEKVLVELTPITPKAQVVPPTLMEITPSSLERVESRTTLPAWECATILLSGNIIAQFIQSRHLKMLVYGSTIGACCLTILKPSITGTSFLGGLTKLQLLKERYWKPR